MEAGSPYGLAPASEHLRAANQRSGVPDRTWADRLRNRSRYGESMERNQRSSANVHRDREYHFEQLFARRAATAGAHRLRTMGRYPRATNPWFYPPGVVLRPRIRPDLRLRHVEPLARPTTELRSGTVHLGPNPVERLCGLDYALYLPARLCGDDSKAVGRPLPAASGTGGAPHIARELVWTEDSGCHAEA